MADPIPAKNEIWTSYEAGNTIYALIWRSEFLNRIWNNIDGKFDNYDPADIDKYRILLTHLLATNSYYFAEFPRLITEASAYNIQILLQRGGSPNVDDDINIAQGVMYWDGKKEDTPVTLSNQMDRLSAQGSRVLNKYPTRSQPDV